MNYKQVFDFYLEVAPFVWAAGWLVWALVFVKMALMGVYSTIFYANLFYEFWPELVMVVLFTPAVFIHLFRVAKVKRVSVVDAVKVV